MRPSILLAIACLGLTTVTAAAKDPCYEASSVRIVDDLIVDTSMTVGAGRACGLKLGYIVATIERVEVMRKPAHGVLTVDRTFVGYRAKPGYHGPDAFTFAYVGQNRFGRPSKTGLNVAVTVTP